MKKPSIFNRLFGKNKGKTSPIQQVNKRHYAAVRASSGVAPINWSADALARTDLDALRAKSRALSRDNDYMRKFLQLVESNIVGRDGFILQMRAKSEFKLKEQDVNANNAVEQAFKSWARRGVCDVTGLLSFVDLQRLIIKSVARDGEALIRHINDFNNPYGYALQVLDIDRLDTAFNQDAQKDRPAVRMGVEIDRYGKPTAYYLREFHPGEYAGKATFSQKRERVPANEISHLYIHDRPEQRRGFPWTATAIIGLTNIGGYQEAAIIAARIGASKMGFFTRGEESDNYFPPLESEEGGTFERPTLTHTVEPGVFDELPAGYSFQAFDPDYPHSNYDSFMKTSLRGIASGLGVSYHSLASDLEGVNFSSIRSGTLEERDNWQSLQNWLVENFMRDVFERWLSSALLKQAIKGSNGKAFSPSQLERLSQHEWQGRRWAWVDPLKDISAQEKAVMLGVKSRRQIASEMGLDFDDTLIQQQQELEQMEKIGLTQSFKQQEQKEDDGVNENEDE